MTVEWVRQAREALDRAAAARPKLDGEALTEATKALCLRRDTLRSVVADVSHRSRELKVINALISLIHAVHFPLGATPWPLLDQARAGLDALDVHSP